jgi:hypothetical protein
MTDSLLNPNEQKAAENVESNALVPNGIYAARVSEVSRWTTGTSLVWKFKIAQGQPHAGREMWTWTGLKDNGIFKTKEYLSALGFGLDAAPEAIIGTPCKIAVAIEARSDTGEPANKVKKVFAYEGPPLPADPEPTGTDDFPAEFGDDSDDALV